MPVKIKPEEIIPTEASIDTQWIEWHKALKNSFGKKQANTLFLEAWQARNKDGLIFSGKANTVQMREYLDKNKIKIEKGVIAYVADTVDDVEDFVFGTLGTAKKAVFVVGLVILVLLVWIIIKIVRNPHQYTSAFASIASRGLLKGAIK